MEEYKVARAFRDSRIGTIGGGSSEIMREIIAKMVIDDVNYDRAESSQVENVPALETVSDIFATLPNRFKAEKAKGKKIIWYCTGGIRCEKAAVLANKS